MKDKNIYILLIFERYLIAEVCRVEGACLKLNLVSKSSVSCDNMTGAGEGGLPET